jgi:nucleoside-diphosphate-sugar epimerase
MPNRHPTLLTGATGQVGIHVLARLLDSGHKVLAPSRRISHSQERAYPSGGSVSWVNPQALNPAFQEFRTLVSSGPIQVALQCVEVLPELKRVVCLSTSSIITKADSSDDAERRQIQQIVEGERSLGEACARRNITLCILRPTLIYGCGMDENISRMARFIQRFGFLPVAAPARGLRQPVHAEDLAALMVRLTQQTPDTHFSAAVAGGSTLSYRDMVDKVFCALGRRPRVISLPPHFLAFGLGVAGWLPALKGLNPAMVLRQNQDLVFDDSELRKQFDFRPRAFEPTLADFQLREALRTLLPSPGTA